MIAPLTGHIAGLPIEEGVVQLASVGAGMVTTVAIAGRAGLARLRRRLRERPVDDAD